MIKETLDFAKIPLEIIEVVAENSSNPKDFSTISEAYTGDGKMVNSEFLNGLNVNQAKEKIIIDIIEKIK